VAIPIQPFDFLKSISMRRFDSIEFGEEAECGFDPRGTARNIREDCL
jgi:hypothetical protein